MSAFLPPISPLPLILPRLLFITPQPILQYLSVSFLHPFLSLHYLARSCPLHLTLCLSNLLTWILFTLLLYFPPFPCISPLAIHLRGPLSISLPPSPPLCQAPALSLLFLRLAVERLHSCWQCCLCELSAELHSPLASHCSPHTRPAATSPPHPPPSLLPFLLPPTYIPLQAGELTFQPWAAGLNDCLWGRLRLHNPAVNIWATHTHTHTPSRIHKATHTRLYWTLALCCMHNTRLQSLNVSHYKVVHHYHSFLPAAQM